MNSKLTIAKKAPDFKFKTPWDDEADFYDAVGNHHAVLIFLRYYGCPVCQMEMAKIKQDIDLVRKKEVSVFVVLQSTPEIIASLIRKEDFPFTIICDPQGKIFQLYGVEAGMIKYLHPAGLIAAIRAVSKGFMHGKFEGKETQLPAAFAMTADKLIKYAYYGNYISDIPSLDKIVIGIKK
jgi:thioredoxin-dependent peroxiredoxin